MASVNLAHLDTWDKESGALNVVIETARGCRSKFKYNAETGTFQLSKVLPKGMQFPFDFGFVPSTCGEDGDPLDVLVLMDEPAFAGCCLACRVIGVIEAEQTEDGTTERNDRLIAVAEHCHEHQDARSIKDLHDHLIEEIEHFFTAYHDLDGKEFTPLGRHGPNRAEKLIQQGMKCFRQGNDEAAATNGRGKAGKK